MPRLNGQANAFGDNILPTELVGNPEAIVRRRKHRVERAMRSVGRILVAARVVVLPECSRFPWDPSDSIPSANACSPGVDPIGAVIPSLGDPFSRVVKIPQRIAFETDAVGLFILLSGLERARRLNRHARLNPPQNERLQHRVRNDMINRSVRTVDIVSLLMMADSLRERNHYRRRE